MGKLVMVVGKFGFDAEVVVLVMDNVLELDIVVLLVERLELVFVLEVEVEDDVTLVPVIEDVLLVLEELEIGLVEVRLVLVLVVVVLTELAIEVFVLVPVFVLVLVLVLTDKILKLELTLLLVLEITLVLVLTVCPPAISTIIPPTKTKTINIIFFFINICIFLPVNFKKN